MIEKLAEYNRIEKTQAHSLITTSAPMIHSQIKNLADDEYVLSFLSPNGILKHKYLLQKPANFEEARQMVTESVEIYNAKRPYIALKYKTPNEVHQAFYS